MQELFLWISHVESHVYRFSWDQEDLDTYPFPERYVKQPEVLAYLNHVVERHELRQYMRFRTELLSAQWSDAGNEWNVTVTGDKKIRARYLITGLGLLSKQNFPEIAGLENFAGEMHHTAKWPEGLSVAGKRVGVIGCGSTGVQVITEIARKVESLTCFQRHPQYRYSVVDPQCCSIESLTLNIIASLLATARSQRRTGNGLMTIGIPFSTVSATLSQALGLKKVLSLTTTPHQKNASASSKRIGTKETDSASCLGRSTT